MGEGGFGVIAYVGVCVCEGGGGREGGKELRGVFFSPSNKQTLDPPSPKKFFLIGVCCRAD